MSRKNKEIEKAVFPPRVPYKAKMIFDFVSQNANLTTEKSGMQGITTGLDRYKIVMLAKEYDLDLIPYDFFITLYENRLLKEQEEILK